MVFQFLALCVRESMKTLLCAMMLTVAYTTCVAQADLEITITNIRVTEGSLRIGLFARERDFPRKATTGKVIAATADSLTIVFTNVQPALYAISIVHDRNNNGKLDTNMFGIPREGFAFGNNALGRFGPPSFKDAQVRIGESRVSQVLVLKYF